MSLISITHVNGIDVTLIHTHTHTYETKNFILLIQKLFLFSSCYIFHITSYFLLHFRSYLSFFSVLKEHFDIHLQNSIQG